MARTIEAVYENGVFKPLAAVALPDGFRVHIYLPVEPNAAPKTPEEVAELIRLAHSVFEGLSDDEYAEIAQAWKREVK
jgi:predicted DNA-binding antitoxin AbrB/MazE fold protein